MTGRIGRGLALTGIAASVTCVALLHVLRTDLPPLAHRLSEYANGPHGWLMALAFIGFAVGLAGFAAWLWATDHRVGALAAIASVVASVVSAVFRTDISTESEAIHSAASTVAVLAVVAVAVIYTWSARRSSLRTGTLLPCLAVAAILFAAIGPVLHETRWSGLGQRLLWAALLVWLLVALFAPAEGDEAEGFSRS